MKTKEREAKRSLTAAELNQELHQTQDKLTHLSWKHSLSPLDDPMELRNLRRYVARLKTWIGQKETENTHGS
jgi:large subunit ribosomal protein L29